MLASQSPLAITCADCGAPAAFKIQRKCYVCQHCGAETDSHLPALKMLNWRKQVRAERMAQIAKHPAQIYDCANCGATTVIQQGEALAQCGFCGTSSVRKAYSNALEALPELIIPFRITKDEAFERLRAWCNKNGRLKEARLVAQHLRQLQGWYLPYNLV